MDLYSKIWKRFLGITLCLKPQYWKGAGGRAKQKDPFRSRKSLEKEEGLSSPQSPLGKADTFAKERAEERKRTQV